MTPIKRLLPLALTFVLFLTFAGCGGNSGGGTPTAVPTTSPGYTLREIDFTDDFSDPNSGWEQYGSPPYGDASYYADTDGNGLFDGYVMQLISGAGTCFRPPYKNKLQGDYTIEVSIKNLIYDTFEREALGGLYFNYLVDYNIKDNMVFVIDPEYQKYAVAKADQSSDVWHGLEIVVPWTQKPDLISKDGFNTLKVEVVGSQAKLSINGSEVANITVPLHPEGETVGLYFSNDKDNFIKMLYDNFHLKGTEIIKN